jgi:hypothetical protein
MAIERVEELAERRPRPPCHDRGGPRDQHVGVLDRLLARQPADGQTAYSVAEPGLDGATGDEQDTISAVRDRVDEATQTHALWLAERRGRAVRVGHREDRLEVVPDQQHPPLACDLQDDALAFGRLGTPELVAEDLTPDRSQHAIQAKGCDARLKRRHDDEAGIVNAAGITPPTAKRLGKLGLARAAGPV